MFLRAPAKLLRLHFSEHDRYEGVPLYEAIARKCRQLGIAGISVLRGMEGYGASGELHRRGLLAHDLPIVVTVVDSEENMGRLLPEIGQMLDTGMIALSNVEMVRIQNHDHPPGAA